MILDSNYNWKIDVGYYFWDVAKSKIGHGTKDVWYNWSQQTSTIEGQKWFNDAMHRELSIHLKR
jgi:hypothetical protein